MHFLKYAEDYESSSQKMWFEEFYFYYMHGR